MTAKQKQVGKVKQWSVYMLQDTKGQSQLIYDNAPMSVAGKSRQGSRDLYVGMTNDIVHRLAEHNAGKSQATKHTQWQLVAIVDCADRATAATLERWLKSGDTTAKRCKFRGLCDPWTPGAKNEVAQFVAKAILWKATRDLRVSIASSVDSGLGADNGETVSTPIG